MVADEHAGASTCFNSATLITPTDAHPARLPAALYDQPALPAFRGRPLINPSPATRIDFSSVHSLRPGQNAIAFAKTRPSSEVTAMITSRRPASPFPSLQSFLLDTSTAAVSWRHKRITGVIELSNLLHSLHNRSRVITADFFSEQCKAYAIIESDPEQ